MLILSVGGAQDQTQHPQELEQQVPKSRHSTMHIITVNAAEDVAAKIMSFCQQGPEAITVFSAIGTISRATLAHPQTSQTLTTYEGKYDLLSLAGSFVPNENGSPGGVMNVSLAGLEGRVFGGRVAGPLVAHGRVSVTVAVSCFLASERHEHKQKKQKIEGTSTLTPMEAASTSIAGQLLPEDRELKQNVPKVYGFPIHTITVNAGQDVVAKIMSFCQQGPETVCIFSVNGAVSSATLSLPKSPQTLTTYEGKYELLSLDGTLAPNENGSHGGIMTVSFTGLEGRVFGGCVAGPLKAHGRVSVVVGRFLASEVTSTVTPTEAASMSTPDPYAIAAAEDSE